MKTARLVIADDHLVVRQGLCNLIDPTPDLQVVAEAADGIAAERLAREMAPDLLILDIALPGKRGMQILESLRASGCATPVLFFTMYPASPYLDYARRNGAQGFLSKSADAGELLNALRRILAGGVWFPRPQRENAAGTPTLATLSPRELQVMRGLVRGEPLSDIAARLGIGAKSISTYRRRLLDKLGLQSNAELAAFAARLDYL